MDWTDLGTWKGGFYLLAIFLKILLHPDFVEKSFDKFWFELKIGILSSADRFTY